MVSSAKKQSEEQAPDGIFPIRLLHRDAVRRAIERSTVLRLSTFEYLPEERDQINTIVEVYLRSAGKEELKTCLCYCIQELAANAKKANTKRVYFDEKGLNLRDPVDYRIGMETFKKDTLGNIEHYLQLQRQKGLSVTFEFLKEEKGLTFIIRNNTELVQTERERIREKLRMAKRFRTLSDACLTITDPSEGAGLGIVMMKLMLRNLGEGKSDLKIRSRAGETTAVLTLPS